LSPQTVQTPPPRRTDEPVLAPEQLARAVAGYAADKKAIDLLALDLRGAAAYTDFFVVCSGGTDRQAKAIHDAILEGMKKDHGLLPRRVEGVSESRWVLMDYWDVVVHIFVPEVRDFYRLEQLWGDMPRLELPDPAADAA
jgi:ribosome-associated protein